MAVINLVLSDFIITVIYFKIRQEADYIFLSDCHYINLFNTFYVNSEVIIDKLFLGGSWREFIS
jgi:hypothetical protein